MFLVVSAPSAGVSNSHEVKTYCSCFKTRNTCAKCFLSIGDTSPPSVYLGRQNVIHMKKWTRPPPPFLHIASDQKLDSGKAWEWDYRGGTCMHRMTLQAGGLRTYSSCAANTWRSFYKLRYVYMSRSLTKDCPLHTFGPISSIGSKFTYLHEHPPWSELCMANQNARTHGVLRCTASIAMDIWE